MVPRHARHFPAALTTALGMWFARRSYSEGFESGEVWLTETRLSCGALKKDSSHNLRAPPAPKRLLDSASTCVVSLSDCVDSRDDGVLEAAQHWLNRLSICHLDF